MVVVVVVEVVMMAGAHGDGPVGGSERCSDDCKHEQSL
jgi:hypothetical protein